MMVMWETIAATLAVAVMAGSAQAADRDFCADRPGKGERSCTLDPGVFQIETGLFDYAHSRDGQQSENDYSLSDLLVRYGVGEKTEARLEWDGYGFQRTEDRGNHAVSHAQGSGDVTLSLRQNLFHPSDKGTAVAIETFFTLPVGHQPIGDGTWSGGVIAPLGFRLAKGWRLTLDPELDAAPDEDGSGRHFAYVMTAAVTRTLNKSLQIGMEGWLKRDEDPSGHQTLASVDLTAAYQLPDNHSQIDISTYLGATRATPRIELVIGAAERF